MEALPPAGFQKVSLFCQDTAFEVRSVDAASGGNTGKVTVVMEGSKFDTSLKVRLKKGTSVYTADTVVFVNSTKVFVTFNLKGANLGLYDVEAIKNNIDTARLKNGFTIVTGVPSDLEINVSKPANVRPQVVSVMSVEFANNGNTDIKIPTLTLKEPCQCTYRIHDQ